MPTDKGAHAGAKVSALVAEMVAGADSIEGMGLLRHGGTGPVVHRALRALDTGVVPAQLRVRTCASARRLRRQLVTNLAARTPLLREADQIAYLDVDDTIRATYGYAKQGAGYGDSGVKGLNALLAALSTPGSAPVIVATRLRKGSANTARSAKRLVADALKISRSCGATGLLVVRADSAFYGSEARQLAHRGVCPSLPLVWNVSNMQERFYSEGGDYRDCSPHLTYLKLYDQLVSILVDELDNIDRVDLPLTVIEAGAGHGGFTSPMLAYGARVTAVEMAEASVAHLTRQFRCNPAFRAEYIPDGSFDGSGSRYSVAVAVAVLHHVPDYIGFVRDLAARVEPGGTLVTLQDPMWYPRHRVAHRADRLSYYAWRLSQGNVRRAAATLTRRMRGVLDELNPSDMVEYHVVRQGVDEEAVRDALRDLFREVQIITYWSNQLRIAQRVGDMVRVANTFGVIARDRYR